VFDVAESDFVRIETMQRMELTKDEDVGPTIFTEPNEL